VNTLDEERKHVYHTLIGFVALFGFSLLLSLTPFAMLSSLTSAVVVSCVHNQPFVSLSHHDTYAATATSSYFLTITNKDTAACGQTVYDLQSALPGQSIGVFSADPLPLLPGETTTVRFLFLIDATLPHGTYPFTLVVRPMDQPELLSSITLRQTIP